MANRLFIVGTLFLAACDGHIGGTPPVDPEPVVPSEGVSTQWPRYTEPPELRLLSADELAATISDALGQDIDATTLPLPQVVEGHSHIAGVQQVNLTQAEAYVDLALSVADRSVEQSACEDVGCYRAWASERLSRVLRHGEPAETYLEILDNSDAGEDIHHRARAMWATLISSPHFLYRQERLRPASPLLDELSIASRLSYLVWQSAPDQALIDAAGRGELSDADARIEQLERMLEDPRARRGLQGFVRDWFGVVGTSLDLKDNSILEGTDATLVRAARQSLDMSIEAALFEGVGEGRLDGSLLDLLTTDTFFVDAQLATILDVAPPEGEGLEARTVNVAHHRGLLMHPAVFAAHTKESGASPFPIGKFIYESMLCGRIPPPPDVGDIELEEGPDAPTLREALEHATSGGVCASCHTRIGPPGFAFLPYDPIGRYSALDGAGRPWDTVGDIPVDDGRLAFESAPDMAQRLAEHEGTARCVARRLFRWTFGRFETSADAATLATIEDVSVSQRGDARLVLRAIVSSHAFALAAPGNAEEAE